MATGKKRSSKKAVVTRKAPAQKARSKAKAPSKDSSGFPERIFAVASPHSVGGVSMFAPGLTIELVWRALEMSLAAEYADASR